LDRAHLTVAELIVDGLLTHDLVVDERDLDFDRRSSEARFERAVNKLLAVSSHVKPVEDQVRGLGIFFWDRPIWVEDRFI